MPFRLSEPVPNPGYVSSGRGGAGNFRRTISTTSSNDSIPQQRDPGSSTSTVTSASSSTSTQRKAQRSLFGDQRPNNTLPSSSSSSSREPMVRTGRGGAGNGIPVFQWALFSFDEELERLGRKKAAPVFHVGRGGVGNQGRRDEDSSSVDDFDDDWEPRTATGWGGRVEKSWNDWGFRK